MKVGDIYIRKRNSKSSWYEIVIVKVQGDMIRYRNITGESDILPSYVTTILQDYRPETKLEKNLRNL